METLTDLQQKVEALLNEVEDITTREYYLFTEIWQYIEDLKRDGDGAQGIMSRAMERKRFKNIKDLYKEYGYEEAKRKKREYE